MKLSTNQEDLLHAPFSGSLLLSGSAGTGKTTAAALRLRQMVESGVPGESILVLVPQRSLAAHYQSLLNAPDFPPGGQPAILTFNGLTQRIISLFWHLIASAAGFRAAKSPFKFLTIETAQYYLAALVEPLLQQGYFESLTIDANRLYSQILDNLNKSAIVGFPPEETAERLTRAWVGNPAQAIIYQQAQECALKFREFCLANNFLDFSLQLTVFNRQLWPSLICKAYIHNNFRHLIYDNIEEDYPVAHDFVSGLLPTLDSALLIQDSESGFRSFLGADVHSAENLGSQCSGKLVFDNSLVKSPEINDFEHTLRSSILHRNPKSVSEPIGQDANSLHAFRFYPEAIEWVINEINTLIHEQGVPAGEIAVLTPYLSDALRFSFAARFEQHHLPFSTYRPSRSLHDDPAVKTVLTLTKLAHPSWEMPLSQQAIRSAFAQAITSCDYARADLLTRTLARYTNKSWSLNAFNTLKPEMQERITFSVGEYYERLREWLANNHEMAANELDHWISRLYGEVLSQPGFGFHDDYDAAAAVSHLIESCRKFRGIYLPTSQTSQWRAGREYTSVLEKGILAAQSYTTQSLRAASDAVFLGPAFSFLMRNKPVSHQFWLDIGSQGWWARLDQPLTQPYVLSRNWQPGQQWTDNDEYAANQNTLARLTTGLLRRCRQHVYLCNVSVNERGLEERGQLMLALQSIQRARAQQNGRARV
jgi:superfamily I DNA/RNA helicase